MPSLTVFTVNTNSLRDAVQPNALEDVLASLLFKRVIDGYTISHINSTVFMKPGRSITLQVLLDNLSESRKENE